MPAFVSTMLRAAAPALAGLLLASAAPARARESAWSFPVAPTDQLAVPGEAAGAEITPQGGIYTGHGELTFWFGERLAPFVQGQRSLVGGRWPIVRAQRREGSVAYTFELFAGRGGGAAATFAQVELRNTGAHTARARFAAGWRWSGGRPRADGRYGSRFERPVTGLGPGLYLQPGTPFSPAATYALTHRALVRDGLAVYLFPRTPAGVRRTVSLRAEGGGTAGPATVFGRAQYAARLRPGSRALLTFAVPTEPAPPSSAAFAALATASPAASRAGTLRLWRSVLSRAMALSLPERIVEDTYAASIVNAATVRYTLPTGERVQPVNKLQYHSFWLRDAAVITWMYDLVGLYDIARENLRFFTHWQRNDGLFISRPGQYDGFGQALWALGQHARRAPGGEAFAREVLPSVTRAMTWLSDQRARDGGLMPATDISDNEAAAGRLTGDNLWAVAGAEQAVGVARLAGDAALATRWEAEARSLRSSVRTAVEAAAARTPGGAAPPVLDRPGGKDFGNLQLAFPTEVYQPASPLVAATMRRARARFREGIATYPFGVNRFLRHGPLGFRVWQTELARGQQRDVVQGIYDSLAHTTATRGGFELANGRGVGDNLTPNGWWAAEYVTLLRNMLVREEGQDLVVLAALPPRWLRGRRPVLVRGARTLRGRVDLELRPFAGGAELRWRARVPEGTRLRWPRPAWAREWRLERKLPRPGAAAALAGKRSPSDAAATLGRELLLPARSGRLRVRWTLQPAADDPGYERSVAGLRRLYRDGPREPDDGSTRIPGT